MERAVAYQEPDSWAVAVRSTYADRPVVGPAALAVAGWAESAPYNRPAYCWAVAAFGWAAASVALDLPGRMTGFVVHALTGIRK